jgi:hypothetical protein
MKAIKLFLIGFLSFVLILILSGIIFSYYNGDRIAAMAIRYLNGYLTTKVTVEEVHFSVVRHFPYASLDMKNVVAFSKPGFKLTETKNIQNDTLFTAKKLSLEFGLKELFNKNLKLKNIKLDKAKIYLLINKNSIDNYSILKKDSTSTTSNNQFKIDLQRVKLTDCEILLFNENKQLFIQSKVPNISFSGKFGKNKFSLSSNLEMNIQDFSMEGVHYVHEKKLKISVTALANKNYYRIKQGKIWFDGLPLEANGSFMLNEEVNLNLQIHGNKLDISNIKSNFHHFLGIPATITGLKGKLSVDTKITGKLGKVHSPQIYSRIDVQDGKVTIETGKKKTTFVNIFLNSTFSNGLQQTAKSSSIIAHSVRFSIEKSNISGTCNIINFAHPQIEAHLNGNINLCDINTFLPTDTVKFTEGKAEIVASFNGTLDSLVHKSLPASLMINGKFENASCNLWNKKYKLEFGKANFGFNKNLEISNLNILLNQMPCTFSGTINNFRNFVFGLSKDITINGSTNWEWFDPSAFPNEKNSVQNNNHSIIINFPEHISFDLNFNVGKFNSSSFQANNVAGHVQYHPKIFVLNSLKFNSMGGSITAGGAIAQSINGNMLVHCQAQLAEVNIEEMFRSFHNFGQEVLQPQHIKGTLTGNIDFSAEWDKNLNINQKSIITNTSFEIRKGELIDFMPLMGLSKFISVNELKHIYFSTLKNQILIKDRVITIPQMDIASSALNLSVSGTHDFDNQYDYHIKVALSEILFRKARNAKKENQENAEEDKGKGVNLYLAIKGKGNDYKVSYDRKSGRKAFTNTLSNETKTIKKLLIKGFGNSQTDTIKTTTAPKKFTLDWDESPKTTKKSNNVKTPASTSTNTKKQKFKIEWNQ